MIHPLLVPPVHATYILGSFNLSPSNDTATSSLTPTSQNWYYQNITQFFIVNNSIASQYAWGWYKFNFSLNYRGNINITSAYFNIYCKILSPPLNSTFGVYGIDPSNESWTDSNVTWNNQPSLTEYDSSNPFLAPSEQPFPVDISLLQTAYNNNATKTYVFTCLTNGGSSTFWNSKNATYSPYLTVSYNQTTTSEPVSQNPIGIPNAKIHSFIYYPIQDAQVGSGSSSTPIPLGNGTGADSYFAYGNIENDLLFQFNLSIPNVIDGVNNTSGLTLTNELFTFISFRFYLYCDFVPGGIYDPFNYITGIYRSNESWTASNVTWNTKPSYRIGQIASTQLITTNGYYSWDLSSDDTYVYYSIYNGSDYTLVNLCLQEGFTYAYWRMNEYNTTIPYILITAITSSLFIPISLPRLTIYNAPIYFAQSLGLLDPSVSLSDSYNQTGIFVAGSLLTALFSFVTIVPLAWILNKKTNLNNFVLLILTFSILGVFVMVQWLYIGIYILILVLAILFGGILKRR